MNLEVISYTACICSHEMRWNCRVSAKKNGSKETRTKTWVPAIIRGQGDEWEPHKETEKRNYWDNEIGRRTRNAVSGSQVKKMSHGGRSHQLCQMLLNMSSRWQLDTISIADSDEWSWSGRGENLVGMGLRRGVSPNNTLATLASFRHWIVLAPLLKTSWP